MNRKSMDKSRELATQGLSDLEWLAFQFLAEELDGAARDTFERQLESDVDAQNAVTKMLELTMQAELAFRRQPLGDVSATSTPDRAAAIPGIEFTSELTQPNSSPSSVQGWRSPISILAAVAATFLLGIAIWQYYSPDVTTTSNPDNQLALIWAENVIEEAELAADDFDFDVEDDDSEFVFLDDETDNWLASAMSFLDEDEFGHLQ